MELLELKNLCFSYTNENIIKNISLKIKEGEFITFLGSSGCGKTTLLKLINGFLKPTSGEIILNGKIINEVLSENRSIAMVFQDYALFPNMNVKENIAYGLKNGVNKVKSKEKISQDVLKTAQLLNIEDILEKFPYELSGGQQQRVALARSLILKPKIILMDEPLSSLDFNLRQKVRDELKYIQKKLNITTIYVTHDKDEAMILSDKIAVINEGILEQFSSPEEIYFNPVNKFVAQFIGKVNYIQKENKTYLVRPEWIKLSEEFNEKAKIISKTFSGEKTNFILQSDKYKELFIETNTVDSIGLTVNSTIGFKFTMEKEVR